MYVVLATTEAFQKHLKKVHQFSLQKGHWVAYGSTYSASSFADSIYFINSLGSTAAGRRGVHLMHRSYALYSLNGFLST